MRRSVLGVVLAATLTMSACSGEEPKPYYPPEVETIETIDAYDAFAEPSSAVLPLVPEAATLLEVTDFDQVRLLLGATLLTTKDPAKVRNKFWAEVAAKSSALSTGMLRPIEDRLIKDFDFGQEDVKWEAHFSGDALDGYVLRLDDDVDMVKVKAAIDAGIGPLKGAEMSAKAHIVALNATSDPATSWGADETLVPLVGAPANATYVSRGCIPFDTAFAPVTETDLALAPASDLAGLDELGAFSVSLGGEVVTARLGALRNDMFQRLRLGEVLPETRPEFGEGLTQGVADPASGRIGYTVTDRATAASLVLDQHLPFAVCQGS